MTRTELSGIEKDLGGLPYRRYVIVPFLKSSIGAGESTQTADDSLLALTTTYIKNREFDALEQSLGGRPNVSPEAVAYCRALLYFFKGRYWDSHELLNNLTDPRFACVRELLVADCKYELFYRMNILSYEDMLARYQKAADCSQDELWKQMVANRIKWVRYKN